MTFELWIVIGVVTALLALLIDCIRGVDLRITTIFGTFFWCILLGPVAPIIFVIGVIVVLDS